MIAYIFTDTNGRMIIVIPMLKNSLSRNPGCFLFDFTTVFSDELFPVTCKGITKCWRFFRLRRFYVNRSKPFSILPTNIICYILLYVYYTILNLFNFLHSFIIWKRYTFRKVVTKCMSAFLDTFSKKSGFHEKSHFPNLII